MDLGSAEVWRWIWLGAAVAAAVGEIAIAGSFALLPFSAGAGAAAAFAFAGVGPGVQWSAFVLVSAAAFAALRPLARRLDARTPLNHVGANRWAGREAVVTAAIGAGEQTGTVRLDGEEWRAQSLTGVPITAGSTVLVSRVEGTRLVVVCLDEATLDPPTDPQGGSA